jgi:hypothetical protein
MSGQFEKFIDKLLDESVGRENEEALLALRESFLKSINVLRIPDVPSLVHHLNHELILRRPGNHGMLSRTASELYTESRPSFGAYLNFLGLTLESQGWERPHAQMILLTFIENVDARDQEFSDEDTKWLDTLTLDIE